MTGEPMQSCSTFLLIWQLEPVPGSGSTAGNLHITAHYLHSSCHSLRLCLNPHTLLLTVKDTSRVDHALVEAIFSCSHQVLCSDLSDEKIPQAAPMLCLGLRQSGMQLQC